MVSPVRTMMPHGVIEATVGYPMITAQVFGSGGIGGDRPFWVGILNELDAHRLADPEYSDAHWIGVVRPPPGIVYTTYGGFAFVPADGADTGPFTRSATRSAPASSAHTITRSARLANSVNASSSASTLP